MSEIILPTVFALRLPRSTRRQADEMAKQEGLSLNQFITLALAEKIVRMEARQVGETGKSDSHGAPDPSSKFLAS